MAHNYTECNRDQLYLLPPSMKEWLPEDHLAWFLIDAVGQMDLSAFHAADEDASLSKFGNNLRDQFSALKHVKVNEIIDRYRKADSCNNRWGVPCPYVAFSPNTVRH